MADLRRCWRCGRRFESLVPDPVVVERYKSICVSCAFDRSIVARRYNEERPLAITIPEGDA